VFGRAAPCTHGNAGRWPATSTATTTATATAKACIPWDGGEGTDGGGRCKYVHVSSVAPCSCALSCAHGKTRVGRPAQPARGMPRAHGAHAPAICPLPASDNFPRSVGMPWPALGGCRPSSTRRSTPCVDALQIQFEIFDSDGDSSTHGVNPSDTGQLSQVGRCRIAGCPRHGCRGQALSDWNLAP